MKVKRKITRKHKVIKKDKSGDSEDVQSRRKYKKGGRIEAYTFGETTTKKGRSWPF